MEMLNEKEMSFAYMCLNHPLYKDDIRYETYKMSETILSEGHPIDYLGIVVDGVLRAEQYTLNGQKLCGAYFENNDTFPEFLYFSGNRVYTYSLVAVRRTKVAWIPMPIFEKMLEEQKLMRMFLLYISQRSLKNQLLLNCLNYQHIQERVAYWIIGMHNISQNNIIHLPKSQTMWADTLHVSRSSLNQELKAMEKEGYFRIDGHYLMILDTNRLNEIL